MASSEAYRAGYWGEAYLSRLRSSIVRVCIERLGFDLNSNPSMFLVLICVCVCVCVCVIISIINSKKMQMNYK